MDIISGELKANETNTNAAGGSELIARRIHSLDPELLKHFHIVNSRIRHPLSDDLIRILVLHDLPGDPENDHLKDRGWIKFHKLVFVSNWQMNQFINHYNIPWDRCVVIQNGIVPIEQHTKPTDRLNLVYFSTPHRGLNILLPVFDRLTEKHDNIHLDVYSSFKLYGWEERDQQFQNLFDFCEQHDKIDYHGSVDNQQLREALKISHIFAYPNTWLETSCLSLIEAMSARLVCVHPNYGALVETSSNFTMMYHFSPDLNKHASIFYQMLDNAITNYPMYSQNVDVQKSYIDSFHNWKSISIQWEMLFKHLIAEHANNSIESYLEPRIVMSSK